MPHTDDAPLVISADHSRKVRLDPTQPPSPNTGAHSGSHHQRVPDGELVFADRVRPNLFPAQVIVAGIPFERGPPGGAGSILLE